MYRASTPLQLPSPRFYLFLLPFSLQALLLNDAFAPRFSRLARLALLPITVYLAIRTPKCYGFEPREAWIGPNAVLAMGGLYCAAKGVEWGLARDAREYRWKGFKDTVAGTATGATDGKKEPFERRNDFETRSAPSPSAQSTYSTLVSTLHLITSMRGAGYPYHSTSSRHPLPRYSAPNFLFRTLCNILISHLALTINASIVTLPYTRRLALVSCIVQTLPLVELKGYPLHCLTESLSYVSWGLSAWTGIALFHSLFTLLSLLVFHTLLRLPFDSRSYPPLFERAWAPHGVRYYWAAQWHQLLRRPFHYLAWDPMERAVRLAGGGRRLGKAMGSLAAFGLTAWVHEFALSSALTSVPSYISPPRTTFLSQYGSTIFFLLMWLGSVGEILFTRLTVRRVGGLAGFIWGAGWQSSMGIFLYASWADVGLTKAIPSVDQWAWQRFVYPLMAFAPAPWWLK